MIGKILKDMHTSTDNEHYEQARVLTTLGYLLLNAAAIAMVVRGIELSLRDYAEATGIYFAAAGVFIFMKKSGGTG